MVTQDMAHALREVNINTNDIINRHDISQEANKLSLIVSELDGQGENALCFPENSPAQNAWSLNRGPRSRVDMHRCTPYIQIRF